MNERTVCNCWPDKPPLHRVLENIPTKTLLHFKLYLLDESGVDALYEQLNKELEHRGIL